MSSNRPAITNLCLDKYIDYTKIFIYKDSTGTPISLSGYTAQMDIKSFDDRTTILDTLTTVNGKIVLEAAANTGEIKIILTDSVTASYTFDKAYYDLVLTAGTGEKIKLFEGIIRAFSTVTQ